MQRCLEPEWIDSLLPDDPRAPRSRRDLLRINAWMGNTAILGRALRRTFRGRSPQRIAELGAGDGLFMLRVARRLGSEWKNASVTLLDRRDMVMPATLRAFAESGWRAEAVAADVFDWLRQPASEGCEGFVCNLFLHHFSDAQLADILREAARRAQVFIAIEPRRSAMPLLASRLLWLIGCKSVTRHDAPISVRAGFTGTELSHLWPPDAGWSLQERRAGLFSHLFVARRAEDGLTGSNHGP